MWIHKEECKDIIRNAWSAYCDTNTRGGLALSLKHYAVDLLSWSHSVVGHIPKHIHTKKKALHSLFLKDTDGRHRAEINRLRKDLNNLLDSEEIF